MLSSARYSSAGTTSPTTAGHWTAGSTVKNTAGIETYTFDSNVQVSMSAVYLTVLLALK